jgi:hypothetical protein
MQSSTDISLDSTFPAAAESRRGALVQDRPTLGSLPRARRGLGWWLPPVVDLVSSSVALAVIALIAGVAVFPAFPIAPLLFVAVNAMLGVYGANASRSAFGGEDGMAWPVIRLLMAAVFAWASSLITPLDGASQLALWVGFAVLDTAGRVLSAPLRGRLDSVERWVLVGDEATATRLKAYEPLRDYASVVCTVEPFEDRSNPADRVAALEIVDRYQADRVVIGTQHADDESLLDLVRAFKSIGVPVSMLPRPLDLLEAPAAMPSQVGGVPLIEVEALAAHDAVPYAGPDRRSTRKTKVSVVVPAMNEAKNIGHVLRQLPQEGLHEVILVDGNSEDDTIEAARSAYPEIRVLVQSGRGKGDAFRTGFAAVTGNLVVMLDADGSADPAEIPRFVEALEAGADFAKGSRYLPGGGSTDITGLRSMGNKVLSGSANLLHGTHFTDLCYGYNAFWARCLPFIALDVPGFEVETLINLRIAGAGMKITEVPSYELDRIHGESNLKTFRDGFRVLGTIISESRRHRSIQRGHHAVDSSQVAQRAKTASAN